MDPHGTGLRLKIGQADHAVQQNDQHHAGENRQTTADALPGHALFPDPVDRRGEPGNEEGDTP